MHLPDGQRIITCSNNGSLQVWNLESGKQIGKEGETAGYTGIVLFLDGKKVDGEGGNSAVRLVVGHGRKPNHR